MTDTEFRQKVDGFKLKGDEERVAKLRAEVMFHFREKHEEYKSAMIDLYERYLSEKAIDASIEFHTSPGGEEVISVLPLINREADRIGAELGRDVHLMLLETLEPDDFLDDEDSDDYPD